VAKSSIILKSKERLSGKTSGRGEPVCRWTDFGWMDGGAGEVSQEKETASIRTMRQHKYS
jgi:hypothetical protein